MSDDQLSTPKLKPTFDARHKRLSGGSASVAYKSPLLNQSLSPVDSITSPSSVVPRKRPRLRWNNKSFRSPVLGYSPFRRLNSPLESSSSCGESIFSSLDSEGASCKNDCKLELDTDPISPKTTITGQSPKAKIFDSKCDVPQQQSTAFGTETLKDSVKGLWLELQSIEKEISDLKEQGYLVEELEWYVDKLHEYNDIKDTAQMVMGRIAVLEQMTLKKVHKKFGLTTKD